MVNIQWYYARTGPGQVADIVSHSAPVQAKLRSEAHRIAQNASAILDSEPKVRTGESQINTYQADLDWYVELKDGGNAAGTIEKRFGVLKRSI